MEDTQHVWNKAYLEALDHDTWGQVEEACDGYQRLQVAAAVEHVENVLDLPPHRRDAIGKLATVLKLRIQELNAGIRGRIGLTGMQSLKPFMAGLILSDAVLPPAIAAAVKAAPASAAAAPGVAADGSIAQNRVSGAGHDSGAASTLSKSSDEADSIAEITSRLSVTHKSTQHNASPSKDISSSGTGTLRPPIPADELQSGDITLCINFVSWAVKGAAKMTEPHVVITVRDEAGKLLEAVQESPHVIRHPADPEKLGLGFSWHMQTPVNCLPAGAAVFFELRHFRPEKKKKSVKCYSYLEASELGTAGSMVLEVYKKPAEYKRKGRPTLLTTKPMYLQLSKALTSHQSNAVCVTHCH